MLKTKMLKVFVLKIRLLKPVRLKMKLLKLVMLKKSAKISFAENDVAKN